ncbi:hypothetical protein CsSME_00047991 [Camellia sinensis var. sinensis]
MPDIRGVHGSSQLGFSAKPPPDSTSLGFRNWDSNSTVNLLKPTRIGCLFNGRYSVWATNIRPQFPESSSFTKHNLKHKEDRLRNKVPESEGGRLRREMGKGG